MPKKTVFLFMLLALVAGLVGGTMGSQLVMAKAKAHKVVQAQEYRLVDQVGVVRASLDLTSKGDLYVALYNAGGKPTDSMVVTPGLIKASRKTAATLKKIEKMFSGFFPKS